MERCRTKSEFFFLREILGWHKKIQIVKELKREKTYPDGVEIRTAQNWLSEMLTIPKMIF